MDKDKDKDKDKDPWLTLSLSLAHSLGWPPIWFHRRQVSRAVARLGGARVAGGTRWDRWQEVGQVQEVGHVAGGDM